MIFSSRSDLHLTLVVVLFLSLFLVDIFTRSLTARWSESTITEFSRDFPSWKSSQCLSQSEYNTFRHGRGASLYHRSEHLIRRLRDYEERHSACMEARGQNISSLACRYVLWLPPFGLGGLGNKMLGLVSTYLYALLTDRVLLIPRIENMDKLFCNPFPNSSWILPEDMNPVVSSLNDSVRLGHLVSQLGQGKCTNPELKLPEHVYAYLSHDFTVQDSKFFCEEQQKLLGSQASWVFIRTSVYFLPGFFYVPTFKSELERLFPEQEAIFHHLGRYLLHPSNTVWGRIRRYYNAYLAHSEGLVGIQMRVPDQLKPGRENYSMEVFRCLTEKKLLPNVVSGDGNWTAARSRRVISGVVASLSQQDYIDLRGVYLNHDTEDGSSVALHQPSYEEKQKTGDLAHDETAVMDIYLLSLCDEMVTSPGSTFGYVAQGLAGIRPWLMWQGSSSGGEVCRKVTSLEPCYFTFPGYNCDCKMDVKLTNVQGCEDAPIAPGMKLKS